MRFPSEWTYAEYARLPDDGNRYEVIDGEVCVTPAPGPRHQKVAANLYMMLDSYVRKHDLGEMFWDVDLLFVSGQFLRPDMLFVSRDALYDVTDRGIESVPDLVVEVLSPHSARVDRVLKPSRYREFGVPDYWVVDPQSLFIEVYRLVDAEAGPQVSTDNVSWWPERAVPPLVLEVQALFRGVA